MTVGRLRDDGRGMVAPTSAAAAAISVASTLGIDEVRVDRMSRLANPFLMGPTDTDERLRGRVCEAFEILLSLGAEANALELQRIADHFGVPLDRRYATDGATRGREREMAALAHRVSNGNSVKKKKTRRRTKVSHLHSCTPCPHAHDASPI